VSTGESRFSEINIKNPLVLTRIRRVKSVYYAYITWLTNAFLEKRVEFGSTSRVSIIPDTLSV